MLMLHGAYSHTSSLWLWLRPHACRGVKIVSMHMHIGVQEKVASQDGSKERLLYKMGFAFVVMVMQGQGKVCLQVCRDAGG